MRHLGKPGAKLPKVIIVSFPVEETERLRIANITNGPSFSEVEVYAEPLPRRLSVQVASDLNGHVLGIVTDQWGSEPVSGAQVALSGQGKLGQWTEISTSDELDKMSLYVDFPLAGIRRSAFYDDVMQVLSYPKNRRGFDVSRQAP